MQSNQQYSDWEMYLSKRSADKERGDEVMMRAICASIPANIHVWHNNGDVTQVPGPRKYRRKIVINVGLTTARGNEHYVSMRAKQTTSTSKVVSCLAENSSEALSKRNVDKGQKKTQIPLSAFLRTQQSNRLLIWRHAMEETPIVRYPPID